MKRFVRSIVVIVEKDNIQYTVDWFRRNQEADWELGRVSPYIEDEELHGEITAASLPPKKIMG